MKHVLMWPVLWYLRLVARVALKRNQPPVIIGIAGSVGKSSTRNAVEAILKDVGKTIAIGNSETGIPLGILGIKPRGFSTLDWITMLSRAPFQTDHLKGTTFLVVEMGIDDPYPPKNMSYLLTIIKPHIGILLNESATHTLQFEKALTRKEKVLPESEKLDILVAKIAEEDAKLLANPNLKIGIINGDSDLIRSTVQTNNEVRTFGSSKTANMQYDSYNISEKGSKFTFRTDHDDTLYQISLEYILPEVYQEVFAASLLAASAAMSYLGKKPADFSSLAASLEKNISLPKGRASIFEGKDNSVIIDSSYNASKASTLSFLSLLATLKKMTKKKIVFVFGDMRELGDEAAKEHHDVAHKARSVCDAVYCVGPLTKEYVMPRISSHLNDSARWFATNKEVGEYLREQNLSETIVLVKGSQNTLFLEESIKYILKNKEDIKKLCRQDNYWMEIKRSQRLVYEN